MHGLRASTRLRSPAAQVMWKVVKPWIHPITRSKIELVGARYEETFREQGIVLTSGGTEVGGLGLGVGVGVGVGLGSGTCPHARRTPSRRAAPRSVGDSAGRARVL